MRSLFTLIANTFASSSKLAIKDACMTMPILWYERTPHLEMYQEIATHPFIVKEKAKQNETFQQLKVVTTLNKDFLKKLKYLSNLEQTSSTNLC